MILAIDMGNTNIVIGGIDNEKTYFLERVTTYTTRTDLEYSMYIKGILDIHGIKPSDIEGAILSSVVPPLNETVRNAIKKILGIECMLVESGNLDMPKKVIAKNTIDSMRSGILFGHAGMMDGIISRMEEELGEKLNVVATGGLAPFVTPLCTHDIIVDDNLLLKGLLKLYIKNYI